MCGGVAWLQVRLRDPPDAQGKRRQRWHWVAPSSQFHTKAQSREACDRVRDMVAPAVSIGRVQLWAATLAQYREKFLVRDQCSPGTIETYNAIIRRYLLPDGGGGWTQFEGKFTHEITGELLQETFHQHNSARRAGQKLCSARRLLDVVCSILKWAARQRIATTRIDRRILDLGNRRTVKLSTKAKALDVEDMDRLIAGTQDARLRAVIALHRYLGVRLGECAAVALDALRLDGSAPEIDINRSARRGIPDTVKSETSDRTIVLPAPLIAILREWIAVLPRTPEGFLFPGRVPGHTWHPDSIRRAIYRLCDQCGIRRAGSRAMRHGAAYLLVNSGNPTDASRVLGHGDLRTTSIYADATHAGMAAVVRAAAGDVVKPKDPS